MSFITSLFSGGVEKIVDSVGSALDSITTSDEERLVAKNVLAKIKLEAQIQSETISMDFEKEVTKRWTSDNDNILTRAVRPAIVVWSFALMTIAILLDGNVGSFSIKDAYIPLIETIVVTSVISYMGSRGFEKVAKIKGK